MWQYPVSFQWWDYAITLHSILEFLAYFIGFRFYLSLRKKQGDTLADANRIWIIIGAIAGAIVGSRLVGAFESWQNLLKTDHLLIYLLGNKSIVGGLLGGLWGVEITKLLIGEKQKSGDLFVYPIIIAMVIGRIGCFSMGVYEDVVGFPTTFFAGMDLGDGIIRHPLMLYEIVFLLLLFLVSKFLQNNMALASGALFKLFMISYLIFRFTIEFLKPHESYFAGLGAIQLACLAGILFYCRYILKPGLLLNTSNASINTTITTI
jgi:phosphatidylglycerol---prolipoprotein diacylglyceryl transferase